MAWFLNKGHKSCHNSLVVQWRTNHHNRLFINMTVQSVQQIRWWPEWNHRVTVEYTTAHNNLWLRIAELCKNQLRTPPRHQQVCALITISYNIFYNTQLRTTWNFWTPWCWQTSMIRTCTMWNTSMTWGPICVDMLPIWTTSEWHEICARNMKLGRSLLALYMYT